MAMRSVKNHAVLALVYEGDNAVSVVRLIAGATKPEEAAPGTIRALSDDRFDLSRVEKRAVRNLVHASSDTVEAQREIDLWFLSKELIRTD